MLSHKQGARSDRSQQMMGGERYLFTRILFFLFFDRTIAVIPLMIPWKGGENFSYTSQFFRITTRTRRRQASNTYQQACHNGNDIGDGVHHCPGLSVHVNVPEHSAVHQRSQEEVDVAGQHQAQANLHQGFVVLEVGATYSWRKKREAFDHKS